MVKAWRTAFLVAAAVFAAGVGAAPAAERVSAEELLSAVVKVKTFITPDAQTAENLGREREGSGIVIDNGGLVLTIGYLMVEAYAAEVTTDAGRTIPATVVGYDSTTGFGLLRATEPPKVRPIALGTSAGVKEGDLVLIAAGEWQIAPAHVVSKREFAGGWEYLLNEAIFTAPAHPEWSGAALIDVEGKLVGVGSLIVRDATGRGDGKVGNMFVPIDLLPPILADLIADGRSSGPAHPWLGMNTSEGHGRLYITRVTPGGPAEKAGVGRGDVIIGVNGEKAADLADLYRKIWARGPAGAVIPLDVMQRNGMRHVEVRSVNRLDQLKLKSTF